MNNQSKKLKAARLFCCLVTASINATTGNIPEMAKAFAGVPLHVVELISTLPSSFQMMGILLGRFMGTRMGLQKTALLGILLCGIGGVIPVFVFNLHVLLAPRVCCLSP